MNPTSTPITDAAAWIEAQLPSDRRILKMLAELLAGVAATGPVLGDTALAFTTRHLGEGGLAVETDDLTSVRSVSVGLALADLIAEHSPEIGPGVYSATPSWTVTEVAGTRYRHPMVLRAAFPAGTVAAAAVVVVMEAGPRATRSVSAVTRADHRAAGRQVLDGLAAQADALNPYRGKTLRASFAGGFALTAVDLPTALTRRTVVVPDAVWREIDLSVTAVRDRYELLNAHGLGVRRGVLLVGPPGVGKSAVTAVVAQELVASGFTAVYVEARAGASLLTAVVEETERWGGPILLVLDDVDLWVRERAHPGGGGLSELLQAMDIDAAARILTVASTNDARVLDRAAIRAGRFDSIVEVPYPDTCAAAQILAGLVDGIPGGVDPAAVAAAFLPQTSGADIREVVRRAVLSGDGTLTTAALLAEVGSGRYRTEVPAGAYL